MTKRTSNKTNSTKEKSVKSNSNNIKIGIIGTGSSATGVSYNLLEKLPSSKKFQIELFDKNNYSGGRAHRIDYFGRPIEIGGTTLHTLNKYVQELMEFVGVKMIDGADSSIDQYTSFGFFDGAAKSGKKLFLNIKNSTADFALSLIKAYGPFSVWKFRSAALKALKHWQQIYTFQSESVGFETVLDWIKKSSLIEFSAFSLDEYYKEKNINPKLATDFAGGIIHNMYNQGSDVNALTSQVSLAGAGLAGGTLFAIEGGNGEMLQKVQEKLAKSKDLKINYELQATKVTVFDDEVKVLFQDKKGKKIEKTFDKVVLSLPFETANIEIEDKTTKKENKVAKIKPREPQQVYATLISGELNRKTFEIPENEKTPSDIFIKPWSFGKIRSIGTHGLLDNGDRIYKVFSSEKLTKKDLDAIFSKHYDVKEHFWTEAYPKLLPKKDSELDSFVLSKNKLYYPNAFESITSTIEVSLVFARNVSNLILQED